MSCSRSGVHASNSNQPPTHQPTTNQPHPPPAARDKQDAFCCFDASEDGYLEPSEVAEVLCTSNTPGRATRALSDKLFAQLDCDGSGGISFKEFLIGLEKMVMEEYVDDDEEEGAAGDAAEEARLQQQAKQLAAQQGRKHHRSGPGAAGGSGGGEKRASGAGGGRR